MIDNLPTRTPFLVAGDVMVDEYIVGEVHRISPEAPIPILEMAHTERTPGGAANVAMNLHGLGVFCLLCGVIGDDEPGHWLVEHLKQEGIATDGLVIDSKRKTTLKTRYGTDQQTILRVDQESRIPISESVSEYWTNLLRGDGDGVGAIILSDYGKGALAGQPETNPFLRAVSAIAQGRSVITAVDTKRKGTDLQAFRHFTFVKPNLSELEQGVGRSIDSEEDLHHASLQYLAMTQAERVLVTLGKNGLFLCDGERFQHVPAISTDVFDVTGAGDTILAVLTHSLYTGLTWDVAMRIANIAAGVIIGERGTRPIRREPLERKIEHVRIAEPDYLFSI